MRLEEIWTQLTRVGDVGREFFFRGPQRSGSPSMHAGIFLFGPGPSYILRGVGVEAFDAPRTDKDSRLAVGISDFKAPVPPVRVALRSRGPQGREEQKGIGARNSRKNPGAFRLPGQDVLEESTFSSAGNVANNSARRKHFFSR